MWVLMVLFFSCVDLFGLLAASFDSPIEDITNEELEAVEPTGSIPYLSFNVDEAPSGPSFYPFATGPPSFSHMRMDPAAPLDFQSNIWFPSSEFTDNVTITDLPNDSMELPLSVIPTKVTPPPTQIIHHPASQVTHLLDTYFQFPPKNNLWLILQAIVTSVWYLSNVHEPFHGLKRSIFLNFLAHRARDPVYKCLFDNCNESFPRQDRALGHVRKHFDYRPFVCTGPCAATGWYAPVLFRTLDCNVVTDLTWTARNDSIANLT
jgi:hypothetical protein